MYIQKAVDFARGERGVGVKCASLFSVIALAFCLLFVAPQKANALAEEFDADAMAQSQELFEILDMLEQLENLQNLAQAELIAEVASFLSEYPGLLEAFNTVVDAYQEVQGVIQMVNDFKDTIENIYSTIKAVGDYYVAFYKAKAVILLINTINQLVEAADIIELLLRIDNAIRDILEVAEEVRQLAETANEIYRAGREIKDRIDAFIGQIREIVNTVEAVVGIVNAISDFQNIGGLIANLKNNSFMKKAFKNISNQIPRSKADIEKFKLDNILPSPSDLVPNFNFDVVGITSSMDNFVTSIDGLVCNVKPGPECVQFSPEWCATRMNTSTACMPGHPDYCGSGFHNGEDVCTSGNW